jgi:hypothetical protein
MLPNFNCRYNLIDGRLVFDHPNNNLIFIRESLGTEEEYASWSFQDIKDVEIQMSLLTQELSIILHSNEILRFATTTLPPKVEEWIKNVPKPKRESTPQKMQDTLSLNAKTEFSKDINNKEKQDEISFEKQSEDEITFTSNTEYIDPPPQDTQSKVDSLLTQDETNTSDTEISLKSISEDWEKNTNDTSKVVEKITAKKKEPEEAKTSGCCSWLFWIAVICFILDALDAC